MPRRKNDEYRPIKEEEEIELEEILEKKKVEKKEIKKETEELKSKQEEKETKDEEPKKRGRRVKEKEESKKENKKESDKKEKIEKKEKTEKVEKRSGKRFKEEPKKRGRKPKEEKKKEDKETKKVEKNQDIVEEIEENTDLVEEKEVALDKVKLDAIEEEIKKQTELPEERIKKINRRIFPNILMAVIVTLYFIFVISGYQWLDKITYLTVQQVYSMVTILITIIIFEIAYKKDSDYIAVFGIEFLILSICSLLTIKIEIDFPKSYVHIMNSISTLFSTYYIGKAIYFYCKMRKKALRKVSDINKVGRM